MSLTYEQKLLLLSCNPAVIDVGEIAPAWLVDECVQLGLVQRVGRRGWKLTEKGAEVRAALLASSG